MNGVKIIRLVKVSSITASNFENLLHVLPIGQLFSCIMAKKLKEKLSQTGKNWRNTPGHTSTNIFRYLISLRWENTWINFYLIWMTTGLLNILTTQVMLGDLQHERYFTSGSLRLETLLLITKIALGKSLSSARFFLLGHVGTAFWNLLLQNFMNFLF